MFYFIFFVKKKNGRNARRKNKLFAVAHWNAKASEWRDIFDSRVNLTPFFLQNRLECTKANDDTFQFCFIRVCVHSTIGDSKSWLFLYFVVLPLVSTPIKSAHITIQLCILSQFLSRQRLLRLIHMDSIAVCGVWCVDWIHLNQNVDKFIYIYTNSAMKSLDLCKWIYSFGMINLLSPRAINRLHHLAFSDCLYLCLIVLLQNSSVKCVCSVCLCVCVQWSMVEMISFRTVYSLLFSNVLLFDRPINHRKWKKFSFFSFLLLGWAYF